MMICSSCKEEENAPLEHLVAAGIAPASASKIKTFKGKGCDVCKGHGYSGRVPVFEFFVVTKEIANLITEGAIARELLDMAKTQGMKTLRESAVALAVKGLVTLEDAIYIT